jgi:hypothetical protein
MSVKRAVPFHDLALLVAQRLGAHEEPAVLARRTAVARLILERLAGRQGRAPFVEVRSISRGEWSNSRRCRPPRLLFDKPGEIQPSLVHQVGAPFGWTENAIAGIRSITSRSFFLLALGAPDPVLKCAPPA